MQINKLPSLASGMSKKVGKAILDNSRSGAGLSDKLKKANKFLQGTGYNPGRGAYYTLMSACVIAPRLMEAREPDEFREILTRDVISVLTILFAMKGLKTAMCSSAQKKAGIVLIQDQLGKNATKMQRLGGYLNPDKGIIPLDSSEILARYSRFEDKESFVKALKTVDKEGGNIAKMFNIEMQESKFEKLKKHLPFVTPKTHKDTPMLNAAKKMFGDDFAGKSNDELIRAVENITPETRAFEGLEDLIGTRATHSREELRRGVEGTMKKGLLNNKDNPLTQYARGIAANFETLSLALTAGFLGFGLPKFNEVLTMKKHLNKPATNPNRIPQPNIGCNECTQNTPAKSLSIHNLIKNQVNNAETKSAFEAFI